MGWMRHEMGWVVHFWKKNHMRPSPMWGQYRPVKQFPYRTGVALNFVCQRVLKWLY